MCPRSAAQAAMRALTTKGRRTRRAASTPAPRQSRLFAPSCPSRLKGRSGSAGISGRTAQPQIHDHRRDLDGVQELEEPGDRDRGGGGVGQGMEVDRLARSSAASSTSVTLCAWSLIRANGVTEPGSRPAPRRAAPASRTTAAPSRSRAGRRFRSIARLAQRADQPDPVLGVLEEQVLGVAAGERRLDLVALATRNTGGCQRVWCAIPARRGRRTGRLARRRHRRTPGRLIAATARTFRITRQPRPTPKGTPMQLECFVLGAAAGHRAGPPAARLDGGLRRPPSLSLPAADHGQHHRLGDPLPDRLHRRVERRPADRHHRDDRGVAASLPPTS